MAEKEKKNGVSWGTTIRPRSANPFICLPDVKGKAPESHLLLHTICFPLHHTKRTTLKKLQKKFISFAVEVDKDADNFPLCEKLYKTFLQEMTTFELPLLKSRAVIEANLREKNNLNELQEGLHHQILQAQRDIEDLKRQLERDVSCTSLWKRNVL